MSGFEGHEPVVGGEIKTKTNTIGRETMSGKIQGTNSAVSHL